ncbi:MAG: hypothetical protein ACYCW6_19440, partial [Candidatus Xenobia bacterium]
MIRRLLVPAGPAEPYASAMAATTGADLCVVHTRIAEEILQCASRQHVDCIVLAPRTHPASRELAWHVRRLLRLYPGIIITVGERPFPPRRVSFIWEGTERAFEILRSLAQMTRPAITLIDTPPDMLEELRLWVGGLEIECRPDLEGVDTDLLVMGRSNLATTRRIIREAPYPVLSVSGSRIDEVDERFRPISHSLVMDQLEASSEPDQDVLQPAPRLLGLYGDEGVRTVLERFGLFDVLHARGFGDLQVTVGQVPTGNVVRVHSDAGLLIEVVLERRIQPVPPWMVSHCGEDPFSVVSVEWLLLQNPRASFSAERPRLPGQEHPGLGIGYELGLLFVLAAERLHQDGLWTCPQFYHNARLYHERFHFVDPEMEGTLLALERDGSGHTLAELSWAVHLGLVRNRATGACLEWR